MKSVDSIVYNVAIAIAAGLLHAQAGRLPISPIASSSFPSPTIKELVVLVPLLHVGSPGGREGAADAALNKPETFPS